MPKNETWQFERIITHFFLRVDIRAFLHQKRYDLLVTFLYSQHQRGVSLVMIYLNKSPVVIL